MGEVYASLIKSVPHSGGFFSVVRVERREDRGRTRERGEREIVPDLTLHYVAWNSSVAGSAAPVRCCLLLGHQRFLQNHPLDAFGEVVIVCVTF